MVAVPTPKAAGRTLSAIIGISTRLPNLRDVTAALITYAETRYVGLSTGRYDIIVEAFFEDQEHLLDFVTNKVGPLEGVVNIETSLILHVAKFSYEWEIP